MAFTFNADEVFEMAEQIERNGAAFYRHAGERAGDGGLRERLLKLSDWELKHEQRFHSLRLKLSPQSRDHTAYDPEAEAPLFLRAMADAHVFNVRQLADPTKALTGQESMPTLLRIALGFEKDSIVFYLGLKEYVPQPQGKAEIDGIIREEMTHVSILSGELRELGE